MSCLLDGVYIYIYIYMDHIKPPTSGIVPNNYSTLKPLQYHSTAGSPCVQPLPSCSPQTSHCPWWSTIVKPAQRLTGYCQCQRSTSVSTDRINDELMTPFKQGPIIFTGSENVWILVPSRFPCYICLNSSAGMRIKGS